MSDGPCLTGENPESELTFRDIEKQKWLAARDLCPCRCGSYCNVAMNSFCEMGDCPFWYFLNFSR